MSEANPVLKQMGIRQLAKDALLVQNASNLAGVSRSFAQVCLDCRALGLEPNHPILLAWVSKLMSLTMGFGEVQPDWEELKRMAG